MRGQQIGAADGGDDALLYPPADAAAFDQINVISPWPASDRPHKHFTFILR